MTDQKTRLRWKLEPRETGLRAVCAGPRGSWLHDGKQRYAHVMHSRVCGWFWVAGWGSGVPHMNTCNTPSSSAEKAKAEAMAYVKQHLAARAQGEK